MTKDMVRLLERADIELIDVADAKAAWRQYRLLNGYVTERPILSNDTDNMKFAKSAKAGIRTMGLALAPHKTSVDYNVCRYATICAEACVAHAGHGRWDKTKDARSLKTHFLAENPNAFLTLIVDEIDRAVERHGEVAVRLNTFSDIPWETVAPFLFERWGSKVDFYDYTKWPVSVRPSHPSYDLTRSASEKSTDEEIVGMLEAGERVAICIDWPKKGDAPATHLGYPVVDGDVHDARFTEPKGVVVLLRPKGTARKSGFARKPMP